MLIQKSAINSNLPINEDTEVSWDSSAAIKRVKDWSSDDNGDIDFAKYRKAFFWVGEDGEKQGDYKLPFADVVDDELVAIWRGVAAAMGALMGARGGVDIPDDEKQAVYSAISKYYKKFGMEPPEMKSVEASDEDDGAEPLEKVYTKAEITEKADVEFTAVASTALEDRHGEIVDPKGWDLKNFKKNPVLLWAHDHRLPAIGRATKVWVEGGKLMFKGMWSNATELGRACQQLVNEGTINSFSVGFIPYDMDGRTYTKQELLEISLVNVPANPDAMMLAYKSLKNSGFTEKTISSLGIHKSEIERVSKEFKKQRIASMVEQLSEKSAGSDQLMESLFDNANADGNKFVEVFQAQRGALQDQLDEDAVREEKYKNMQPVHEVFWAFCDVYYDEETPVEDFKALMTELTNILGQIADGTYTGPEGGNDNTVEMSESEKVVDKTDDDNQDETIQVKAQANTDTSAAPQTHSEKINRTRKSLAKAIVRSSDQLLEGEKKGISRKERVDTNKIIKRAAEILIRSYKV